MSIHPARTRLSVCVCGLVTLWLANTSSALAAPITFNTALPVAKKEFVFRQQIINIQSGDDPSEARRDREEILGVSTLGYGINNKLALFAILPYRDIELEANSASGRVSRSTSGVGDARLFGRYIFYQDNQPGSTFRLAAFAGLKTPTGEDRVRDSLGILPPPAQTGTGSWDGFAGVVVTRQTLEYQFDGQLSYRINTEANNFEVGDILRLDASLQKRVYPRDLGSGVPGFLYAVLEANLTNQRKNTVNNTNDGNSGGTRLLIAPGLQYVTRRWIAEGTIQFPTAQNLNGDALELDTIARIGIRFNF